MGFFSAKCKCCGLSILNPYTIREFLAPEHMWLTRVIGITPLSSERKQILRGVYDGYGRIESAGGRITDDLWDGKWVVDLYHEDCWKLAGEPLEFTGGSQDSDDQGFFIRQSIYINAQARCLARKRNSTK